MPGLKVLKSTKAAVITLAAVVVAQGLFGLRIASTLFYRTGAYFLDAGFYVYAVASEKAPSTPGLVAEAWGDSVFKTHTTFSPMVLMGLLRSLFPIPVNLIVYLGLQQAVAAFAAAATVGVAARMMGVDLRRSLLMGSAAGLLLPLSNIAMGSLAYPHVELLGASCITIGLLLLCVRWMWRDDRWILPVVGVLFLVGILAREDLGGQLAITVMAAAVCGPWTGVRSAWFRRTVVLTGIGGFSTVGFLVFQRVVMDSKGAFQISYSGTPPYKHITSVWYLVETFLAFMSNRLDVCVSLVVFVAAGFVFKRREFFAYPLAFLPWMLLNVTSVDPSKKVLGIYLMFPMIIYMTAPILAVAIRMVRPAGEPAPVTGLDGIDGRSALSFSYLFAVVALFLGGVAAPPTGGGYVYYSMLRQPLVGPGEIRLTNRLVSDYSTETVRKGVDSGVMSLNPVALEDVPMLANIAEPNDIDSMMFFPVFLLGEADVRRVLQGWIDAGRRISMQCLPGGMVRTDAGPPGSKTDQTAEGQFSKALRCHPRPQP